MTRRIPFNPHQFLEKILPTSAFRYDMDVTEEGREFSQGWFGGRTSPAALIVTPKNKLTFERYLINWQKFVDNLADSIGMALILNDNEVKNNFGISDIDPRLDSYANKSLANLDARSFFEDFGIDREQLNSILKDEYHFDFAKTVQDVKLLLKALTTSQTGEIRPVSREIIKRGPETLEASKNVHKVIEAWLLNSGIDSGAKYPDISESINISLDYIIDDLTARIEAAKSQYPGRQNL